MLSKPVIVPTRIGTADPTWKIITGNGFDSTNGTAALLVIDAGTGAVTSIPAAQASPPAMPNGLSSVVVIDRWIANTTTSGRDGYGDTAYAGDQHGNIWKFDLRNNTLANGGLPIFTASVAGVRQPITGGIEAAAGPGGGIMLYFGTGSFAFEEDPNDLSLQTVYAVLDKAPVTPATLSRANLGAQTLSAGANSSIRSIVNTSINYVSQSGWYMDLAVTTGVTQTLTGERFVANPRLQSGLILFPVFEPGSVATDPCDTGGTNWLYGMNAISGASGLGGLSAGSPDGTPTPAGTVGQLLDTTGEMPVRDFAVLLLPGTPFAPAGGPLPPDPGCKLAMQGSGADTLYMDRACGRQSWRQIR
jgi:type IV pilus assembly protein PilY1